MDDLSDRFTRSHEKNAKAHAQAVSLGTYVALVPKPKDNSKVSKATKKPKKDNHKAARETPKKNNVATKDKKGRKGAYDENTGKKDA